MTDKLNLALERLKAFGDLLILDKDRQFLRELISQIETALSTQPRAVVAGWVGDDGEVKLRKPYPAGTAMYPAPPTAARDAVAGQEKCKTCNGHGLVGRMTVEGGEGWPCPECDPIGASQAPAAQAKLDELIASAPAPSAEASEPRLEQVIKFLLGEGSLDGHEFSETHATLPGHFWWRVFLRKAWQRTHPTAQDKALVERADLWLGVDKLNIESSATRLIRDLRNALARQERPT